MSESPEWMAAHKGRHLRTVGMVWECLDDCGCEQAQIVSYYEDKTDPRFRVPIVDWRGEFRSDHEPGAEADLSAYRRALRMTDPDRATAIEWQRGVDYDTPDPT